MHTEVTTVQVFNLEVENLHTFFVGEEGVVVHNGRPGVYVNYETYGQVTGYYTGQSDDIDRRRKEHNKNKNKKGVTKVCEINMPNSSRRDRDRMENFIHDSIGYFRFSRTNRISPPNKGK